MDDHIEHAPYSFLYEAVFQLKEVGFKLDVTRVGLKGLTKTKFKQSALLLFKV